MSGIFMISPTSDFAAAWLDELEADFQTLWFAATNAELLQGLTPSELLLLTFGPDLTQTFDGRSMVSGHASDISVILDGTAVDRSWESLSSTSRTLTQKTTTAYMVAAQISNLPPVYNGDSTTQLGGFLDCDTTWGLAYDVDVMFKRSDHYANGWISASDQAQAFIDSAGSWDYPTLIDDARVTSVWPLDFAGVWLGNAFKNADLEDAKTYQYATTFAIEAIGYDFYNTFSWSGWSKDANEALHNNEVFRAIPRNWSDQYWANDPSLSSPALEEYAFDFGMEDSFILRHTYQAETAQAFASKYHATYDATSLSRGEEDPGPALFSDAGPWYTNNYEKEQLRKRIEDACDNIGPTIETTVFPKRLLNHIQRRKKIPNNLVSAFGYVPGEMYTATAKDSYTWVEDSGDSFAYDPVTGEVMSSDARFGEWIAVGTDADGEPEYEWSGESRGIEEGWDDDAGSGEGTDVGGTTPDWWDEG